MTSECLTSAACGTANVKGANFFDSFTAGFPNFPNLFTKEVFSSILEFPKLGSFKEEKVLEDSKNAGLTMKFTHKKHGAAISYTVPGDKQGIYLVGDNLATNNFVIPGERYAPGTHFGIYVDENTNFYIFDTVTAYNQGVKLKLNGFGIAVEKHQIIEFGWEKSNLTYAAIACSTSNDETVNTHTFDYSGKKILTWKHPDVDGANKIDLLSLGQDVENK